MYMCTRCLNTEHPGHDYGRARAAICAIEMYYSCILTVKRFLTLTKGHVLVQLII